MRIDISSPAVARNASWKRVIGLGVLGLFTCNLVLNPGCSSPDATTDPKPTEQTKKKNAGTDPSVPAGTKAHTASKQQGANPALDQSQTTPVDNAATQKLLTPDPQNPLVGTWVGTASLNQGTLEQKLARSDQKQQVEIKKRSKAFLSSEIAIEFYNNGRFIKFVQITGTNGKKLEHEIVGTWKVIEKSGDSFNVQLEESFADDKKKEIVKSYVRFRVHPEGNQMIRPATVHKDLERCEPMFVFVRANAVQKSTLNVAEQPGKTVR